MSFRSRGGERNLHQGDDGGGNNGRRNRVHHDAEGTMIRVARLRMSVRHLGDSQQSKQRQTHQSDHHGSVRLRAALRMGSRLESGKQNLACLKNTQVWMR